MHVIAIQSPKSQSEELIIDQMFRLRGRIFHGRLGWDVRSVDGRECDQFDGLAPTYIIALDGRNSVVGCARLLPATGPTMLETVFPTLLSSGRLGAHERMVESSRFCVDTTCEEGRREGQIHDVTRAMFSGILEWCISQSLTEIATATDVRFERILKRAGWPLRRLGDAKMINETRSVAGLLSVDQASFDRLRPTAYSSELAHPRYRAA